MAQFILVGEPVSNEIDYRIGEARAALKKFGYDAADVSAREFYDYMTGEIFSDDPTTLRDVLNNEYIMIHELVEISELKRIGRKIDKHVIMETPKIPFYTAHFDAMETELKYALYKRDTYWAKIRLRQHKESVVDDDPNLPEELRPRAEEIYEKYRKLAKEASDQPMTM
jgi:LmbE family N-acetylglucosaminyl deacetylase